MPFVIGSMFTSDRDRAKILGYAFHVFNGWIFAMIYALFFENLNKAIVSARQAADNLNAMLNDARPGVQNFTKSTLPEANKLVHDLRELSQALEQVSNRVNQQGIGGALGPEKLPDYKPGKRK